MATTSKGRRQRGIALIEALVALLLFSLAVLGLVGLQASMTRAQTSGKFRADASFLADQLIGVMWTDTSTLSDLSRYATANCDAYSQCQDWKARVARTLPGASSAVTVDTATGRVTIQINWTVPNEGAHSYTTEGSVRK